MSDFRKKPVVIQAERTREQVSIVTLEGTMVAEPGDWIITGVKGERYPCKDDIFRATYEAVDDDGRAALAAGEKPQLIINDLQPLPPNCTVHENTCVGYEFRDETGRVAVYHPKDDNSIRALVWEMYRGRISNEKCT